MIWFSRRARDFDFVKLQIEQNQVVDSSDLIRNMVTFVSVCEKTLDGYFKILREMIPKKENKQSRK